MATFYVAMAPIVALLCGCQTESTNVDGSIAAYRDRMLVQHQEDAGAAEQGDAAGGSGSPRARPVPAQSQLPERAALLTQPATTTQPAPAEVLAQIPDPVDAGRVFLERLEKLRQEQAGRQEQWVVRNYERVVQQASEYLKMIARPAQFRLSLAECIQRALENNYTIRIEAHNPAISQTQIVEAEAAFDVEFYLDTSWANQDRATASTFIPGTSDTRSIEGGFRKLLPTGMTTSVGLAESRSKNNLPQQYQTMNPVYNSSFVVQLRQPLLRGFGLDVNRAPIQLAQVQYQISRETFIQKVRETLLEVEQTYWQLAQARRQVAVLAETVAQNLITYQNIAERLEYDATQIEVANSQSRWRSAEVSYLQAVKLAKDAEDRLKNVLNDPSLKLSEDIEIVPTETPLVAPTVLDHFAEVRTALDTRSEIRQAKERIHASRISTATAKNAILPQLDLSFQYEVQGIGDTGDNSFDNLTTNRFISYTLAANFSYNFGERKARAAYRRARLQESQAVVALNQVSDLVVEEVNDSIRTLMVRYQQLPPALDSILAAERNLRALQARSPRADPLYLQNELQAVEQLGNTRFTLLQVLTDYNVGIVQLEKAKGTLLEYNNVVVSDAQPAR
jgi:outer membrane protein TolC